jgi:hypothetical protein
MSFTCAITVVTSPNWDPRPCAAAGTAWSMGLPVGAAAPSRGAIVTVVTPRARPAPCGSPSGGQDGQPSDERQRGGQPTERSGEPAGLAARFVGHLGGCPAESEFGQGCLRSTNWRCGAMGWLLRSDARPPDQLPPATGRQRPAPAARRASATHQPRMGGLPVPLGHALLGQHLAQPGMLAGHASFPSCVSAGFFQQPGRGLVVAASSGWSCGVHPESGRRHTRALCGSPSLAADPLRRRFAPAGRAG